jgi:P27 family predicted phage terminase small subunit
MTFAAYCAAYGRWRLAEEMLAGAELLVDGSAGNRVPNPLIKIAQQAARDLIKFGNEFGLTPSSRARVRAGVPEDHGKFSGLLA